MLTLEKFKQASAIVKEVTLPTKLVYSEYLSKQTGADVYLKPENMQYTGAYKVRGAYYKISTMSEEDRKKGLVTASAGNHAQGVAYAAKKFGCKATVVMPTVTPLIKVNRTKSYGAEVVLHGDVYDDACAYAMKLAEEEGCTNRWRRSDHRSFDTYQDAESECQSNRCRTGCRCKHDRGIERKTSGNTCKCQYDR